jgi:hypothetical protein
MYTKSRFSQLTKPAFTIFFAALVLICASPASISRAQGRDHLTDPESELVRFYQEIDKRVDVFIKAIDRRFAIINGTAPPSTKKMMKDEPEWGDAPQGTRAQLVDDIAGILDEAITNLDNAEQKNDKNPELNKALRKLSTATTGYLNQLAALKNKTTNADELAAIDRAADNAKQIIDAGAKLPAAVEAESKKKKKP